MEYKRLLSISTPLASRDLTSPSTFHSTPLETNFVPKAGGFHPKVCVLGLTFSPPIMRWSLFSWVFLMAIYSPFFSFSLFVASGQCLANQQTLLLQFRNSNTPAWLSTKLDSWNESVDCCSWGGIKCSDGHVVGLDLANEFTRIGLKNSSSLFSLSSLQSLNLASNDFNQDDLPSEFGKLTNLRYLNLSNTGFAGQIPKAISQLTRLVVLDLSSSEYSPKLENPNLNMLVQNLSELTELYLDGITISSQDNNWCQALSSSLLNLRVLSLSNCDLSSPIDSSLWNLQFLSVIHLSGNNFSMAIPEFFANFKSLTSLNLSSNNFNGKFPMKIFQVSTLQELDLSNNNLLQGSLPKNFPNGSLRIMKLEYTNFSGTLPESIGNLKMLSIINIHKCNFIGSIPKSVAKLKGLVYLNMSSNQLDGSISIFSMAKNLSSQITSTKWENFVNLEVLDLSFNSLDGIIPISLFSLPSLQELRLSNNQFFGQVNKFSNGSSSLEKLDLSSNNLEGPIPISIFELPSLKWLSLSSNNFSSSLQLGLTQLRNLSYLNQSSLQYLDLSKNQIKGEIPNWIQNLTLLEHLNLSYNSLESLKGPSTNNNLMIVDLHSNLLSGQLPIFPNVHYLDLSSNNFSSIELANISSVLFVSLSSNMLSGNIHESLCNATNLKVLDLSNNSLSGTIPQCLIELSSTLKVLNLGSNKLNGTISNMFPNNCILQTLILNENQLKGELPKSLANCSMMEVLDVRNNNIEGTFPFHLKNISTMRVLILRSNKFQGHIPYLGHDANWSMLQILDLASNNFMGRLSTFNFSIMRSMIVEDKAKLKPYYLQYNHSGFLNHLESTHPTTGTQGTSNPSRPACASTSNQGYNCPSSSFYYQDVVTITVKGSTVKLQKILTAFSILDFSCNKFDGFIPEKIGELKLLHALNLSHNVVQGPIPPSLGNLTNLESLDLSSNNLTGKIPEQLADSLIFLSVLNLSFNQLKGQIPKSNQFLTFENTSFEGNKELCGFPLSLKCTPEPPPLSPTREETHLNSEILIDWNYISVELGYVFGLGAVILPLTFWKKWRARYYQLVGNVVFGIFP